MAVYVYHLDKPYHHARHYVGYTEDYPTRAQTHLSGSGSPLLRAAKAAGIGWTLVIYLPDAGENTERWIKGRKNTPGLCPLCNPEAKPLRTPYARPLMGRCAWARLQREIADGFAERQKEREKRAECVPSCQ